MLVLNLLSLPGAHPGDAGRAAARQHSAQPGGDPARGGRGVCPGRWQMWFHRLTDCRAWRVPALHTRFVATHDLHELSFLLVLGAAVLTPVSLAGLRAETGSRVTGTEGYETEGIRGLRALGVRELSYKLVFLACYVAPTNPRVSLQRKEASRCWWFLFCVVFPQIWEQELSKL